MATKAMGLILVIAVLMLCRQAKSQTNCTSTLMTLSSCLNYVTGNSSTPSQPCCTSLDSVVQSQPRCLCTLLNNGAGFTLGIAINQTLALALPSACNVATPPVSQCNAVSNAPAPSPVSSSSPPTDDNTEQPEAQGPSTTTTPVPSVPSGAGSKTGPGTTGSPSDGSRVATSVGITIASLFIAAWMINSYSFEISWL